MSRAGKATRLECLVYAFLAAVLGFCWQTTLVYSLYNGNWSALFYHGKGGGGVPNEPAFANTYVFPDEFGFDGQYYRIIAHDPFVSRGYLGHIHHPMMRYRRILVPLLAYAVAFGRQQYIDGGIIGILLLFFSAGVYWLARYAVLFGRSARWGWAFFLAPATLAGLERGAIDTALIALTIGFALYLREQSRYRLWLVLAMAGLCRETGICLILGYAGWSLLKRSWTELAISGAALSPVLAWYGFVQVRIPPDPSSDLVRLPLTDLVQSLLHYDASYVTSGRFLVQALFYLAVLGVLLAFLFSIRFFLKDRVNAEGLAALAFTMTGLLIQAPGLWVQPYYFGRVLAPLLVLLGLQYFPTGDWRKVLPAGMVAPSILLVSAASALRVIQHLRR